MDMQCMLQTAPTSVLFGGHQEYLVEYDLAQSMEVRTVLNPFYFSENAQEQIWLQQIIYFKPIGYRLQRLTLANQGVES